jgi:hypothetical protein
MQPVAARSVSPIVKRAAFAVAVVAASVIWYLRRDGSRTEAVAETVGEAAASNPSVPAPGAAVPKHVTKVSPDERRRLADRIAAAQSTHLGAISAPERPKLPDVKMSSSDTEGVRTSIRSAMREAIPILAECYDKALPKLGEGTIEVRAHMTLTGDPDVGTLIDADRLGDKDGKPLLAEFDDCLRSTFQTLALPPLVEGDKIEVTYPLVFSSHGPP